jgi:uncharacterized protein YigE (DUF2233 family)
VENKNNVAKNNLEKLDEENENLDEKIENETGERNDEGIINSVIVKFVLYYQSVSSFSFSCVFYARDLLLTMEALFWN